jgi:hypothetical protein
MQPENPARARRTRRPLLFLLAAATFFAVLAAPGPPAAKAQPPHPNALATLAGNGPVGWDTLRNLGNLAQLAPPGVQTKEFSSFARDGSNDDGFDGRYSCQRQDASGCVIAEDNGPGEIDSIWDTQQVNALPGGDVSSVGSIRIELDGQTVVNRSLQDLVNGGQGAPFQFPLVANASQSSGGVYVKVPMAYRGSMRITVQNNPFFYHVTYRHFPSADGVSTFNPGDHADDVLANLRAAGTRDPKPAAPGASTQASTANLPPGGAATLAQPAGPGSISALRLKLPDSAKDAATLRNLRVRLTFDGRTTVDSPVGEFFGSGLGDSAVRSLMFAMDPAAGGWDSAWWPMPYRSSATVQVVNTGSAPVNGIGSEVTSAPDSRWTDDLGPDGNAGYFTTQSRAGATTRDTDWTIADAGGRGRLVGVSQTMRGKTGGPGSRGYLEGDERIHLDSSSSPQEHGTGTEDFYEGGWYFNRGQFTNPLNGNPSHQIGSGGCSFECDDAYRVTLSDSMSYASGIRFGIEHGQGNDFDADYGSTAYLYTRPEPSTKRTDTIDAGNPGSRGAHAWSESGGASQAVLDSTYEGDNNDLPVRDDVRSGGGDVSFSAGVTPANSGVLLRRTSDQAIAGQRADVLVDGKPVGTWFQALGNGTSRWMNDTFALPASATSGKGRVTVTLRPVGGSPPWTASGYDVDTIVVPTADTAPPSPPGGGTVTQTTAHSVQLQWNPAADDVGAHSYRVYGSASPGGLGNLLGETHVPAFIAGAIPPNQTRFFRVVAVDAAGNAGAPSGVISGTTGHPTAADFNGDGKDDVATFTRGDAADVYASMSDGSRFVQDAWKWHDHFAAGQEIPLVGDFNGDGKDDVATFTRGDAADVYVSLSDGTRFVQDGWKWHDHFAAGDELPLVGDFNGDGKDDIATFTRGATADVYVSLSDGHRFVQDAWKWHDHFAAGNEIPVIGDFNGDGRDDIATFTTGDAADVYVSLSDGTHFVQDAWKWADNVGGGPSRPWAGDVNGDGKADAVVFVNGTAAVAISGGAGFGAQTQWHDHFAVGDEIPGTGDFTGDGKSDIVTFTRGDLADVYVAWSDGTKYNGTGVKWHDHFAGGAEIPRPGLI